MSGDLLLQNTLTNVDASKIPAWFYIVMKIRR